MVGLRAKTFHFFRSPLSLQIQNHESARIRSTEYNWVESVRALRLNPPLCVIIGIGCRYLSHGTRPLKSSTAQPTLRIGKIRLWLNRIKRGKFTFGNSKSERVEGSSRVAPAPLLCTCLLSLPPLLLLYSILSPRFRETDASSLFRLVLHGIVPLERCTMRTPQSSRLFTHRQRSIPCIAFCFQTRAPTLERGGGSSWHGCRRGWEGRGGGGASAFHAPLTRVRYFCHTSSREKGWIDSRKGGGSCSISFRTINNP